MSALRAPTQHVQESRSSPGDKAAAWVAGVAGSWPFLLIMLLSIFAWFVINAIRPIFDPESSAMLDYLGTVLAIIAALQGPLILLSQRRESDRDRARDIETFVISQNTEADLHSIGSAVTTALEQWERDRAYMLRSSLNALVKVMTANRRRTVALPDQWPTSRRSLRRRPGRIWPTASTRGSATSPTVCSECSAPVN